MEIWRPSVPRASNGDSAHVCVLGRESFSPLCLSILLPTARLSWEALSRITSGIVPPPLAESHYLSIPPNLSFISSTTSCCSPPPPHGLKTFHSTADAFYPYPFSNMDSSTHGRQRLTFAGGAKRGRFWWSVLAIVANVPSTLAQNQFQQFFPAWDGLISQYLRDNCTDEVSAYKGNPMGDERWKLVECVLGQFSETRKAEAAAAALTLGLAPMLLQSIGPNTSQTSALFMRRPLPYQGEGGFLKGSRNAINL